MISGDTYYDVLGVPPGVDATVLRSAYLKMARLHHPDFQAGEDSAVIDAAAARMRMINSAWEVLGNPAARDRYDSELLAAGGVGGSDTRQYTSPRVEQVPVQPEYGSGTAPPRWLMMAPVLCFVLALFTMLMGFMTGLVGLLGAGLVLFISSGALFLLVPLVALTRSKRG